MINIEGIVLRKTRYGENSMIADILTREQGVITIIAGQLQSRKGQRLSALLQIGRVLELVIYYKEQANMHRLKEARMASSLPSLAENLIKGTILLFMMEVSRNALLPRGADEDQFQFVWDCIHELEQQEKGLGYVPLTFMIRFCKPLGIRPSFEKYSPEAFFDMQQGTFSGDIPQHPHYLSWEETHQLVQIAGIEKAEDHGLQLSRTQRNHLLELMIRYYRLQLDYFRPPRSHEILVDLFS